MTTRSVYCNGLTNGRILNKLEQQIPNRQATILAEGDSWFAIPTPYDLYPTNILHALDLAKNTGIIDLSVVGDKATDMAQGNQYAQLKEIMVGEPTIKLDAILLSAGGNDVIERVEQVIGRYVGPALATAKARSEVMEAKTLLTVVDTAVVEVLADIADSIEKICAARGAHNANVPVIIHGYAHVTPREAPARVFSWLGGVRGPWLKKRLDDLGIHDPAVQKQMAQRAIDRLNDFYRTSLVPKIRNAHYLDLRSYVAEAKLDDLKPTADWNDEIHPGRTSLGRIAAAYAKLLDAFA